MENPDRAFANENIMKKILLIALAAGTLLSSCAPKAIKTTRKTAAEDLSVYRPKYKPQRQEPPSAAEEPVKPTSFPAPSLDSTGEVVALLDSIGERNRKVNFVQGYTIVVRGGQKDEAIGIRQKIMNLFPDTNPQLTWDHPSYKIKVGQFYSKIEANKLYVQIKKEFPNRVILAPENIRIN